MAVAPGAPPLPPPAPGPGARAAPPVYDPQDHNLLQLCYRAQGVKPMDSLSPPGYRHAQWPGASAMLAATAPGAVESLQLGDINFRQVLMTALASLDGNGSNVAKQTAEAITIRAFFRMTGAQRINCINAIWNAAAVAHPFNTAAQAMVAPAGVAPASAIMAFPSSWCPNPAARGTYHRRYHNHGQDAWAALAVGFRVESTFERALANGFQQQRASRDFMLNRRGQRLAGTTVEHNNDAGNARYWSGSNDMWNESGVCICRNLFGACAFPERTTQGPAYLFAVNCMGLQGFDCEAQQGARVWRPGEKAFGAIPANRIIGHVPIYRRGQSTRNRGAVLGRQAGGYNFMIGDDPWTINGNPAQALRDYIEGELDAWRGSHTLDESFDFADV